MGLTLDASDYQSSLGLHHQLPLPVSGNTSVSVVGGAMNLKETVPRPCLPRTQRVVLRQRRAWQALVTAGDLAMITSLVQWLWLSESHARIARVR